MPTSVFELKMSLQNMGLTVTQWSGANPRSNNIFALQTKGHTTLVYAKESNSNPGFWGLTANRLSELRRSGYEWLAILLLGSHEKGYVLSAADVEHFISSSVFRLAGDGDHKVNERDLPKNTCFPSVSSRDSIAGVE